MSRQKRRASHAAETVAAHVNSQHPRCPDDVVAEVVRRVSEREWKPAVTLGEAVGRVLTAYIRHRLTDYDMLLRMKVGLTREEALIIVAGEVRSVLQSWSAAGVAPEVRPSGPGGA